MNLGELIVELSLDSAQFTQELDAAKKRASEAAKAMENIFSKRNCGFNKRMYRINKR